MSSRILIVVIALLVIAGGAYWYFGMGAPGFGTTATSTPSGEVGTTSSSSSGGGTTVTPGQTPEALCEAAGGTYEPSVSECVLPLIYVTHPTTGSLVTSTLTVTGRARGYWYFEASFPLEITDSAGRVISQSHAEAQSNWMTEEYVPFVGRIPFSLASTTDTRGFVIFRKDNPSGLPENDASVSVPVRFR